MEPGNLPDRFGALRTWTSGRAPHKPLLALWAIGRCLRGEPRMVPFSLVDRELTRLLERFGPPGGRANTRYPFWRMCKDGIWEVDRAELVSQTTSGDALHKDLIDLDIHGGLLANDYSAIQAEPGIALRVADSLIEAHFPDTYRDDILRATGIDLARGVGPNSDADSVYQLGEPRRHYEASRRLRRDPAFRFAVLAAYGDQCAICRFDVRMAGSPLAIEAAHIHWHTAFGPADVRNGLALCALHHRLFDRGAFTLSEDDLRICVSKAANGQGFDESLGRFNGQRLGVLPRRDFDLPASKFLSWHHEQVFRG